MKVYNLPFAVRTHIYGIWYIVGRGYHVRWYQYMAGVVWEAKLGIVIPPGSSSFTFTPNNPITGSTYIIRGTGMFSFNIL
jgi:hypothetical protein